MPQHHPSPVSSIRFSIRHRVPGRLRIRLPALGERPGRAADVEKALLGLNGVFHVRANPVCASVVIHHRASAALSCSEMVEVLIPVIGDIGRARALVPGSGERPARVRPVRQAMKLDPGAQQMDCVLCQLKLSLARLIVADLWRCWRHELEGQMPVDRLPEHPIAARQWTFPRMRLACSRRLSALRRSAASSARGRAFRRSVAAIFGG